MQEGKNPHRPKTDACTLAIDFSKLAVTTFEKIPTARGTISRPKPLQDKTNITHAPTAHSMMLKGSNLQDFEDAHCPDTTTGKGNFNDTCALSKKPTEQPVHVPYLLGELEQDPSLRRAEEESLPTVRSIFRTESEKTRSPCSITSGYRNFQKNKYGKRGNKVYPLLRVRSPPCSTDSSPTPTVKSVSTSSSDARSYTDIFRDLPSIDSFVTSECSRQLFPLDPVDDQTMEHDHKAPLYLPCDTPRQVLRCDKCNQIIANGNFREHNRSCVGKKCNRCFKIVVGSYEAHKKICVVRKCDRCGIIPHNSFREHNRICKQISSSLCKRWLPLKKTWKLSHSDVVDTLM